MDLIQKCFGMVTTEKNSIVERYKVLIQEFQSIENILDTEYGHKKTEILERADIVKKGIKSYSISIDTYEDNDFWQVISDLKQCKSFIYLTNKIPPTMDILDYEKLNIDNKEFVKKHFNIGGVDNNIRYTNKIYFTFYV